jgi:hypothetical protein
MVTPVFAAGDGTLIFVAKRVGTTAQNNPRIMSVGNREWGTFPNTNGWSYYNGSGVFVLATEAAVPVANYGIVSTTLTASGLGFVNGTGNVGIGSSVLTASALTLGTSGISAEFGNFAIAEVIYYTRVLTDSERGQVEAYLKTKYGTP